MADELKPCPFCGDEMLPKGDSFDHPASDTCPLDCMYLEDRHIAAWNRRTPDLIPRADADLAVAEVQRLLDAVEALVVVLDRNDKKGPIPDVEMMFCWLASQGVRAAFRKIAQKGEAT